MEQFARIAKNLLSHENQELFGNLLGAAKPLTQSLTSNALKKGTADLTSLPISTAVEPPVVPAAVPSTLISSSASKDNKENEDKEEKKSLEEFHKALKEARTDEERKLLNLAVVEIMR